MRSVRRFSTAVTLAIALLSGCAESRVTAPQDGSFDVAAAGAANASLNGLVSGPGISSVAALGAHLPADLGGPSASPVLAAPGAGIAGLALRLLESLPAPGGPFAVQVIRPSALGRTYVYDPAVHHYVPEPTRAGAPANGVRFILYAVDSASHEPRVGQETGYADLTDDGAAAGLGVSLHFRAVSGGRTFLDYAFALTPAFNGATLRVAGFLADYQNRLDFTLGAAAQSSGGSASARVTFEFALPNRQFHATGTIAGESNGPAGALRIDVSVTIGADTIHLTGESSGDVVSAALFVNGRLFATITGNPHHPTVRGEGGRELSPEETQALGGMVGVVYGVLELFEHLLEPVAALLGVGLAL